MRIPFIAGNWKMFKTVHDATVYVKELRSLVKDVTDVRVVIAPPFTATAPGSSSSARCTGTGSSVLAVSGPVIQRVLVTDCKCSEAPPRSVLSACRRKVQSARLYSLVNPIAPVS